MLPTGVEPGAVVKIIVGVDPEEQNRREEEVKRVCERGKNGLQGRGGNRILDNSEWIFNDNTILFLEVTINWIN